MTTQIKGNQIQDGSIKSEDIDDVLEKDFTKVRTTTNDSAPDFLYSKISAGENITISVSGTSGSNQTLVIAATGSFGGGSTGPQGPQGYQGDAGPQGSVGAQGSQGENGQQGPQGPTGPQGNTGAQGSVGAQGPKGDTGFQGSTGDQGPTGPQGPQGAVGQQGSAGAQGDVGLQGTTGPQGPAGLQGFQGSQGQVGSQGSSGAQGADGVQGQQGSQGAIGQQGLQGSEGSQGPQGFQGFQGSSGATGQQGFQGATGTAGVQGSVGPQGFQGIEGSTGPQGPIGLQGALGAQGSAGAQGNQGFQGQAGSNGSQGSSGPQGFQGVSGATGPQGPQGLTGAQGNTGSQGSQGSQGSIGLQGAQGAAAPSAAPISSSYVVMSLDAALPNDRVLTAGSGITITDSGAGAAVTISASAASGSYTTTFTNASLSGGALAVTHGLNSQYVVTAVYDNLNKQIVPDEVTATSANVTTIDLTSFGSITGTWSVIVVRSGGTATSSSPNAGLVLIESKVLASPAQTLTFSNLNGNVDKIYKLFVKKPNQTNTSSGSPAIRPNGVSTGLGSHALYAVSDSASALKTNWSYWYGGSGATVAQGSANHAIEITIFAETGSTRWMHAKYSIFHMNSLYYLFDMVGWWTDTTTNLTSLELFGDVMGLYPVGTMASLYKVV